ncbi:MAG: glycosyltransferase family 2 protein [Caulobacterales bacterium]
MKFTVLIPTHTNGAVIGAAIDSVLAQTVQDFEIFVVCDGAIEETIKLVNAYTQRDPRIRAFQFAKGERHGEAWRHLALTEATGAAVCYLSDDDFWFPDHLETMGSMLSNHDFAHTRQTQISPIFTVSGSPQVMTDPAVRQYMLNNNFTFCGLTVVGHRLDFYRSLPEGWTPAPKEIHTDLNMWRKILRAPDVRIAGTMHVTSIHSTKRPEQSTWTRLCEVSYWQAAFADAHMIEALRTLLPRGQSGMPMAHVTDYANKLREGRAASS